MKAITLSTVGSRLVTIREWIKSIIVRWYSEFLVFVSSASKSDFGAYRRPMYHWPILEPSTNDLLRLASSWAYCSGQKFFCANLQPPEGTPRALMQFQHAHPRLSTEYRHATVLPKACSPPASASATSFSRGVALCVFSQTSFSRIIKSEVEILIPSWSFKPPVHPNLDYKPQLQVGRIFKSNHDESGSFSGILCVYLLFIGGFCVHVPPQFPPEFPPFPSRSCVPETLGLHGRTCPKSRVVVRLRSRHPPPADGIQWICCFRLLRMAGFDKNPIKILVDSWKLHSKKRFNIALQKTDGWKLKHYFPFGGSTPFCFGFLQTTSDLRSTDSKGTEKTYFKKISSLKLA